MTVIALTSENFDKTIDSHELVVVDFWAQWCAPCVAFSPIFKQVAETFSDVCFAQVDIEAYPDLAKDFNIRSVPMLMIFKKNIAVFAESGVQSASGLTELVESAKTLDISQVLSEIKKLEDNE